MQRLGENIYPKALRDVDLLTALADGVVVADSAGQVLFMNEPALEMHHLNPAEVAQKVEAYARRFTLTTLDGEPVDPSEWPIYRVIRGETIRDQRLWLEHPGSAPRVIAYSGTPVFVDGLFAYALLTIRDTTSDENASRRLRESESRFRAAMEQYPGPLVIYDADLRVDFLNRAAAECIEVPRDQAKGTHVAEINPMVAPVCIPLIQKAFSSGEVVQEEVGLILRGEPVEMILTFVPLVDTDSDRARVLGIANDLSEVHRTKRELAAMVKELEGFAHAVSHDLKSPLRAVTAFSEILLEEARDELSSENAELLHRIRESGLKMSDLLDGIVRLTRISMEPYQPVEVDLTSLVQRYIHENRLDDQGVSVVFPPHLRVYADDTLLLLVLDNLLKNAVKFSRDADQPLITVGHAHDRDGERVCFVSDNGVGFDPAETGDMFKPFHRFHHERDFEGSGIGLAIARRAIERHGGRIWADSEPGKGAIFYFSLPYDGESQRLT